MTAEAAMPAFHVPPVTDEELASLHQALGIAERNEQRIAEFIHRQRQESQRDQGWARNKHARDKQ